MRWGMTRTPDDPLGMEIVGPIGTYVGSFTRSVRSRDGCVVTADGFPIYVTRRIDTRNCNGTDEPRATKSVAVHRRPIVVSTGLRTPFDHGKGEHR